MDPVKIPLDPVRIRILLFGLKSWHIPIYIQLIFINYIDLIQTQRKEFYLVNKGYLFVKDKDLSDGRSFWKCKENGQSRKSCRVRLHCIDGQIIEEKGEHTHAPDAAEVDA